MRDPSVGADSVHDQDDDIVTVDLDAFEEAEAQAPAIPAPAEPGAEHAAPEPARAEPETPTPPAGSQEEAQAQGGLSTPQMLQLMRLEMDRAQRHRYPISCLVIGLDGFEGEEHVAYRKALMPAIFHELKVVTFENDVRGLGTWSPTFQFACFPHVEPKQIASLATQLIDRVRKLHVEDDERTYDVTISIGVAHNQHSREMSFEDFLDDAERGMRLAQSRGGDRCEMFTDAEEKVDSIKVELQQQAQEIRAQQKSYFEEKASNEERWGRELVEKVLGVFHTEQEISEGTIRLEKNVVDLISREVVKLRESSALRALAESQAQIANLERRVAKLTNSLDMTEKELKRVASMKSVDTGVASIYRSVQGLSDDDDNAEQKREMLQDLFDSNLAFRKELAEKKKST